MTDNRNKLTGWHFVAGARCPKCQALDTVKFHFVNCEMLCVDCEYHLDEKGIAHLKESSSNAIVPEKITLKPMN